MKTGGAAGHRTRVRSAYLCAFIAIVRASPNESNIGDHVDAWKRRCFYAKVRCMIDPTDDDLRQDIMSLFTSQVGGGFRDREEIWVEADDLCEQSSNPDAMRTFASSELDRLWKAQRAAEATWPERTDCDRLDAAFAELEGIGIVCRQDFTCCSTCGGAEIGAECADELG